VLAGSLALALSCVRETRDSSTELIVLRGQLDTLWLGLSRAMTAGDTASLGDFYTDAALFAETGAPTVKGLAGLRAAAAAVFTCCRYLESTVRPELTELFGDRAFQFGTYRDVIQPTGQAAPTTFYGRYSAIFDRDSFRSWRIARITIVRDSAMPPSRPAR
jgi:ketosteroid isomerase-like protein